MSKQTETPRKEYIGIIRDYLDVFESAPPEKQRAIMASELHDAGYIKGVISNDETSTPARYIITGLTVSGRLFLQELHKQERENSWWGRIKANGTLVLVFFFGVFANVLADLIKVLLGIKI